MGVGWAGRGLVWAGLGVGWSGLGWSWLGWSGRGRVVGIGFDYYCYDDDHGYDD